MNILYIHTGIINDTDVADTLRQTKHNIYEILEPDEANTMEYAEKLIVLLEANSIEVVMALHYYPMVSMVCETKRVKYVSWICSSYEPAIYSCTLLNECNYVFMADYAIYQEFAESDFKNVFYLPLAANVERIGKILCENGEDRIYSTDILMLQDIFERKEIKFHPLSINSPLKDATKGYLEGCIACQYQLSGLPSMAEHLPSYVREDLEKHFIPRIQNGSIETKSHYYDYTYFNDLITYADRDIHLNTWAKNKYVKKVDLYSEGNGYESEEICCHKPVEYLTQLPLIIRQGKINFVVTHRNWKSGIPQISWDIMAAGGFLLSNVQEDFFRLFSETLPVLYCNERDMLSKGIYYLHHEQEREEVSEKLLQEVKQKHTYVKRLEYIFSRI